MQRSVWGIVSSRTAAQVRDDLIACLDSNDKLFDAALTGEAAWAGYYGSDDVEWLEDNL